MNDVCANRKPYFFYYRYPACKSDYDDFVSKKRRYAAFISNRDLNSIIDDPDENELEFANDYHKNIPLIDYDSPMNKICHWMENNLKDISLSNIPKTPKSVIDLMITGDATKEETDKIKELYKLYSETKRMARINADINIDQYSKELRKEALLFFGSSEQIANATIKLFYIDNYSQGKSFAWNVFGKYILDNIIYNTKNNTDIKPSVPILDNNGDITYLYKKYKEVEFEL